MMIRPTTNIRLGLAMAITAFATAHAQTLTTSIHSAPALTLTKSAGVATMIVGLPVKDELLAGTEKFAQGATSVTEINLDPNTMSMMGSHGKDADAAHKMTLMVVHTYSYDKTGMYRQEDVDAFRKKLEDGSWNCSVHTRNENGSSDICSRPGADKETNEMVIFTAKPQKLTFIHMSGKMSLNELSEMSGQAHAITPRHLSPIVIVPTPPLSPIAPVAPIARRQNRGNTAPRPATPEVAPTPPAVAPTPPSQ